MEDRDEGGEIVCSVRRGSLLCVGLLLWFFALSKLSLPFTSLRCVVNSRKVSATSDLSIYIKINSESFQDYFGGPSDLR